MDIASVSAVLGSIKTATDVAKFIKDSGASLEKAELKLQMAELFSALADAKMNVASIQKELLEKDEEISLLKKLINTKENMVWEPPLYWIKKEKDKKDGPYCQQCYDNGNKLIRLTGRERGSWQCKTCKNDYFDRSYNPLQGFDENDDYDPLSRGS